MDGSIKKSGNRLYIGNFENGKPHGYGTLFNSDGLISFQGLLEKRYANHEAFIIKDFIFKEKAEKALLTR